MKRHEATKRENGDDDRAMTIIESNFPIMQWKN